MRKPKFALAYLLLVGVPLLGLVGIFRAGRLLIPPISAGGVWNLDADFNALGNAPCAQMLGAMKQPFFSISQSGSSLVTTLNDPQHTTLPGDIQGTALSIGQEHPDASAGPAGNCSDNQSIYLKGAITKQGEQRFLTGTLSIGACENCAPIPFHAVRQVQPGKVGR